MEDAGHGSGVGGINVKSVEMTGVGVGFVCSILF